MAMADNPTTGADDEPRYRSGAVARMARMPVATLRVWERRYQLTAPALTASGQRLYSANDVHRLALIRQLTALGHAIGALAPLDLQQLQAVAATHFSAAAATPASKQGKPLRDGTSPHWRVAVVGPALARRLRSPALLRQLGTGVEVVGPFDALAQAAHAADDAPVDAVLVHAPTLHPGWLAAFDTTAPALRGLPTAVLYGMAADSVCAELATAGVALLREPQADPVLGQWLRAVALPAPPSSGPQAPAPAAPPDRVPPRRWSDTTLAELAAVSTTIACECPRHVADLLLQLTRFEAYSAECANRSAADAALHAYLGQVAGTARAQFEQALARVAAAEGLPLPAPD